MDAASVKTPSICVVSGNGWFHCVGTLVNQPVKNVELISLFFSKSILVLKMLKNFHETTNSRV